MDMRERLLGAAARVYAETGYRGATTRRIALEAGVNEITLFRHFGSKDALIHAALTYADPTDATVQSRPANLPDDPVDPERELTAWCRSRSAYMYGSRLLIRKVMGEIEEHPEIMEHASNCPSAAASDLSRYIERLRERGMASADVDPAAASAMLMGALFAEAMGRDCMPDVYHRTPDVMLTNFVRLFVRGIGARQLSRAGAAPPRPRRPRTVSR